MFNGRSSSKMKSLTFLIFLHLWAAMLSTRLGDQIMDCKGKYQVEDDESDDIDLSNENDEKVNYHCFKGIPF